MGKVRAQRSAARVTKPEVIPLLRDGDRMNTAEFMRRYEATPEGFRAELINGCVYVNRWVEIGPDGTERVMPPISSGGHGTPQIRLGFWAEFYSLQTNGVEASAPTTVNLSATDSAPEPDALLRLLPEVGGTTVLSEDDYLEGVPELIIEIANTTAARDLGEKLAMYQRNRVPEYLVWRTAHRVVDWFRLNRRGTYVPLARDAGGVLKSRVFPGLWLDPAALTAGNRVHVFAVLQQGIASPEHAAFVERLRKRAAKKKR